MRRLNSEEKANLIMALRTAVASGSTVSDLARMILREYEQVPDQEGNYDASHVIDYFLDAFNLPIKQALRIALWHPFKAGTFSDEEIDAMVMPYLLDNREQW